MLLMLNVLLFCVKAHFKLQGETLSLKARKRGNAFAANEIHLLKCKHMFGKGSRPKRLQHNDIKKENMAAASSSVSMVSVFVSAYIPNTFHKCPCKAHEECMLSEWETVKTPFINHFRNFQKTHSLVPIITKPFLQHVTGNKYVKCEIRTCFHSAPTESFLSFFLAH